MLPVRSEVCQDKPRSLTGLKGRLYISPRQGREATAALGYVGEKASRPERAAVNVAVRGYTGTLSGCLMLIDAVTQGVALGWFTAALRAAGRGIIVFN